MSYGGRHPMIPKWFSSIERMIAIRYLRSKRRDGFISLISLLSFIGITLGVATLIIVMAVMNGFRIELVNHILGVNGHINIARFGQDIDQKDYNDIMKTFNSLSPQEFPAIKSASGMIEGQIMASSNGRNQGVIVRGHDISNKQILPLVREKILSGQLSDLKKNTIAIGSRLAFKMGLTVGDKITLISPRGRTTPFGTTPRIKAYPIGAIFELGMSLYDENFVFMDLTEAQNFFLKEGKISLIDIHLQDVTQTNLMKEKLEGLFGTEHLRYITWEENNSTYLSALEIERTVMFIILSLIILVASLNIISGMVMLVKDKTHDIAILRTIGAGKATIMRIFFLVGSLIGVAGTLCGLIIGVLFCTNIETIRQFISTLLGVSLFDPKIYFLAKMPAEMTFSDVSYITIMALTLTFISVIFPARRAAKMHIADILRHE